MASISQEDLAELFGEMSNEGELEQLSGAASQDLEVEEKTADEALRQLRHREDETASQMGKVQAELQAQQTQTAALLQALHKADVDQMGNVVQEQSRCAWQQGCITHLTHQLASLQAQVTHLKAAQASPHVEQAWLQTQSTAEREHLERVSDYQAAEVKLQREIYRLRSLMTAHGLDPALASEVLEMSPSSMATTPDHLCDTSPPSATPVSGAQGLSTAALSPGISPTTASLTITGFSTSTAQGLMDPSAALAPGSPAVTGKVGASAGHHYASSQQSLNAGPTRSRIFSGRHIAGPIRADPHFPVRMLKQQQARQGAVALPSAATPSNTSSTTLPLYSLAGVPSNKENSPSMGKTKVLATSSQQVSQQQPLSSRALPQLTCISPTACRSPVASMDDGDEIPTSPPFSPHALQLRAIPVPFWGVPALPVAAPIDHATAAVPVIKQLATDSTAAGTVATATAAATAAAPATAAASPVTRATATTAAGGVTTAMLADQDPTARMLDFADAEQTAAAAQEPTDMPIDDGDVIPTSPPFSPHALQLRAIPVPFWGVPALPVAAPIDHATAAVPVIKQLATDSTAAGTVATATAAAAAAAPATAAASPVTRATATTAAGGVTTAMLADQDPTARMLDFADAEQTAAAAQEPTDMPIDDGDVIPTSPPFSPHALQLRAIPVPFWGMPALPVAAPIDYATAAVPVIKQLATDSTAAGTVATATAAAPAATAAAPATAAASPVTRATATTAAGGETTAMLADRDPTTRMLEFADAEQTAAAAPADAPGTSSIISPGGAVFIRRRLDSIAGTAARPSPAAGKTFVRGGRGPLAGGTPLLSTGRRPSLHGSKGCMMANSNCHSNRDTTSKDNSCSGANKENRPGTGKTTTPATSSLWASRQQPQGSRVLPQLTPCSPTACRSPSAAMDGGDEASTSPGFSPHALQFQVITVPFWGVPASVPLPAAADDYAITLGTSGTATAAATVPASAAAPPATAAAAVLPEQTSLARKLHISDAEQAAAPAASVEPSQACLPTPHAERQHNPLLSCDIIGAASVSFQAPASSATTSSQSIISDNHAAHSPPRQDMVAASADAPLAAGDVSPHSPGFSSHALQLRATTVPFWGEPAPLPLAAANNSATAAGTAGSAMAAATSVPAATSSVAAAIATPATATTADQDPVTRMLHLTDAEQAAAPAATVEPSQAFSLSAHTERRHCAHSGIADISGAVTAKMNQPRGSSKCTASVAAPTASRIMTRSQAAAQKHVQRIRMRNQKR